jgi:Ca-activated chloride channel homolog
VVIKKLFGFLSGVDGSGLSSPSLSYDQNLSECRRGRSSRTSLPWLRMGSVVLLAALALWVAPRTSNSQSGRQKSATPTPTPFGGSRSRQTTNSRSQPPPVPVLTRSDSTNKDSEDVVRVTSSLVPVPATVMDIRGTAVTNLKLEDFELRIDGQLNRIADISRTNTPVRMAMLFDNSGSQAEAREFEKRAAVKFFHNVLRPVDQAAIYAVSTDVQLAQGMTNDIGRLSQTIESFGKPEGATSLYDAIFEALNYLKPYTGRRVIVIVSDGRDTTSRLDHDFDATLLRLLSDECQVYVVQTGVYDNANVRDLAAERRMQEFSAETGGATYIPRSFADLDSAFTQIAADLGEQYVLSYYPDSVKRDGKYHVIAVSVKNQPNMRVRARKGFLVKNRERV